MNRQKRYLLTCENSRVVPFIGNYCSTKYYFENRRKTKVKIVKLMTLLRSEFEKQVNLYLSLFAFGNGSHLLEGHLNIRNMMRHQIQTTVRTASWT